MNCLVFNDKYLMGRPCDTNIAWEYPTPVIIPRIYCKDGFNVSLQVGPGMYCAPRNGMGPWFQVEIGFPSEGDDRLTEYMEPMSEDPTENVYGYVPLEIVLEVFESHGGIDEVATKHWSEEK